MHDVLCERVFTMRILIVEDEPKMASYLRKGLMEASFTVDVSNDGSDGLFLAIHEDYDLIVLDVMLPELDGGTVLRRLRERSDIPVLILSAHGSGDRRVEAIRQGADDSLPKPFSPAELVARVQAILHRSLRTTGPTTTL